MINVLVSCLEVSADHITAFFIRYVNKKHPNSFRFFCIAGEEVKKIKSANVHVINDLTTINSIGIFENIKNFFTYLKFIRWFKNYIKIQPIELFLAVDGQGINIPLGKIAKKENITTVYLFPPPVFTFGRRVLKKMKQFDLILCPFKKDYQVYQKNKFPAFYVGHPYFFIYQKNLFPTPPPNSVLSKILKKPVKTIALFPGSRYLEIKKHTRILLKTAKAILKENKKFQFIISLSHKEFEPYIQEELKNLNLEIPIFHGYSDFIIKKSFFIFATSGTTTLKASLLHTPHIITYQLNSVSYFLYQIFIRLKLLIYTPYIGTINVYEEKLITPELMNKQFNPEKLKNTFKKYSENLFFYNNQKKQLKEIAKKYGKIENPFAAMIKNIKRII